MASAAQRERRKQSRWHALIKRAPGHISDDIAALLDKRCRSPFHLWKRGDSLFLDSVSEAPLEAKDPTAMSATFRISTPRPDREEDVIVPEGVVFDDYRLNPVVMWDHGFTNLTLPIGNSVAPDGTLAISVIPGEAIDATCYFSQSLLEAAQVFELVNEGILRAASIHVDPLDAIVRAQGMERPGLLVKSSTMIEWSICAIGCNPDAVRKALSAGRLAGKPIHEGLAKSLSAQAAPLQKFGKGISFSPKSESSAMNEDDIEKLKKDLDSKDEEVKRLRKELDDKEAREKRRKSLEDTDEVKRLRKEMDDTAGDDDEAKSKRKSIASKIKSLYKDNGMSEDDANIPDEPGEPGDITKDEEDGDGDRPLGSQVLGALHAALSDVAENLGRTTKPLENPEVKAFCAKSADALQGMMGEAADLHKSEYPDHPELGKEQATADPDNPNNEPQEASGMVKFLARNNTNRLGVKGAGSRLDKLCNRKDVPKAVKQELQGIAKTLARISDEALAKSKTAQEDAVNEAALGRLNDLETKLDKMVDALASAIPHRR